MLTDAGGNDLLEVHGNHVELLATFPSRPERNTDAVPTTVTQGPDGSYYVGELSGGPFNVGASNVYRVSGGQATVYCSGFSFIISMAWGPDGHLYVLQFASAPGLTRSGRALPDRLGLREDAGRQRPLHAGRSGVRP